MSINDIVIGVLNGDKLVSGLIKEDKYLPQRYQGAKTVTYPCVEDLVKAVNTREVTWGLLPENMLGEHSSDVQILEQPRAVQRVNGSSNWTDYTLIAMGEKHYLPSYLSGKKQQQLRLPPHLT